VAPSVTIRLAAKAARAMTERRMRRIEIMMVSFGS
jgi:hypothetical protein